MVSLENRAGAKVKEAFTPPRLCLCCPPAWSTLLKLLVDPLCTHHTSNILLYVTYLSFL